MDKEILLEKKTLAMLGVFFLIPPILGILAFVLQLFDADWEFSKLYNLTSNWTSGDNGMSAAPIYMALMAFAGIWLIKDNLRYLLKRDK